jgi:MoxR-like ATPase
VATVEPVMTAATLAAMQAGVETVHVDRDIASYCVDLAVATRAHGAVQVGASPRGSQGLMLVARARAVIAGRDYVAPDDVKAVAVPVLAHRLSLTAQAWATGVNPRDVVTELVNVVPGPPAVGAAEAPRSTRP